MRKISAILIMTFFVSLSMPLLAKDYRIIVLPFDKLNREKDQELEILSKGIRETLAGALSTVKNFIVIDSQRVKHHLFQNIEFSQSIGAGSDKEMDKLRTLTQEKLKGDYIIYGSFYRIGKKIKLDAKFLNVTSGKILKAASVHGGYPDQVFDLQDELASRLTESINGKIDTGQSDTISKYTRSTDDYSAYQHYIKGRLEHLKFSTEDYPNAVKYYRKAIAVDPGYALAWAGLCEVNALWSYQVKYAGGRYKAQLERAVRQGEKAVELGRNLYQTHRALSLAYIMKYKFKEAAKIIEPAYKMNPLDPEILRIKANLINYGGKEMGKKGSESNRFIMEALRINPDLILARWSLASSLSTLNKKQEALNEYFKILKINPQHPQTLHSIALIYYDLKKYNNTVYYGLKAVRSAPSIPQQYHTLGLGYYKLKQWDKAEKALKEALRKKPDDIGTLYSLGSVYYEQKIYSKAGKVYGKILKQNPKYKNTRELKDYCDRMTDGRNRGPLK